MFCFYRGAPVNRKIICLLAIAFGFFVGFFQIHNADIWWHIAWGNKMLEQLRIFPDAESFYFTPISIAYLLDLPNTFLGDCGFALLYKLGGNLALQLSVLVSLFLGGAFVILVPLGKEILQSKCKLVFALLLFFGLCLGTSQLQLVRNSLVSLLLFPIVLGIYSLHIRTQERKLLILYLGILLIWSCIHSSYILGIISLLLLYCALFLSKKNQKLLSLKHLLATLVVLIFTMSVSLTYSWQVRQLINTPINHSCKIIAQEFERILTAKSNTLSSKAPAASLVQPQLLKPFWSDNSVSGDFTPTWKTWRHPAAWSSFLLSFIALLTLLGSRSSNRLGMFLLLAFTSYFGFCYFRGTGYAAITAVFVIASICSTLSLPSSVTLLCHTFYEVEKKIYSFCIIVSLLAVAGSIYLIMARKSEFFFMERGRVFGIGEAVVFEKGIYDFVKNHYPNEPCFTTMVTGSYALLNWKDQKKVFIDAFFAPHPNALWSDYYEAPKTHEMTPLENYGIQLALIENSRLDWQNLFLMAPLWRPIAIGLGATLYQKQEDTSMATSLNILFTLKDIQKLPSTTGQRAAAAAFYNSILALQLGGNSALAGAVIQDHPDLFKNLVNYLSISQQSNIRQTPPGILPITLLP